MYVRNFNILMQDISTYRHPIHPIFLNAAYTAEQDNLMNVIKILLATTGSPFLAPFTAEEHHARTLWRTHRNLATPSIPTSPMMMVTTKWEWPSSRMPSSPFTALAAGIAGMTVDPRSHAPMTPATMMPAPMFMKRSSRAGVRNIINPRSSGISGFQAPTTATTTMMPAIQCQSLGPHPRQVPHQHTPEPDGGRRKGDAPLARDVATGGPARPERSNRRKAAIWAVSGSPNGARRPNRRRPSRTQRTQRSGAHGSPSRMCRDASGMHARALVEKQKSNVHLCFGGNLSCKYVCTYVCMLGRKTCAKRYVCRIFWQHFCLSTILAF